MSFNEVAIAIQMADFTSGIAKGVSSSDQDRLSQLCLGPAEQKELQVTVVL